MKTEKTEKVGQRVKPLYKDVSVMDKFLSAEQEIKNNRVQNVLNIIEKDARDNFKNFRVSDFYMENLQACGAVQNLKTVQYSPDIEGVVDSIEAANIVLDMENK